MKTANLTVRIDPKLKQQAQEAADFLDCSLSQVVTSALKGLVRQAESHRSWVGDFKIAQKVERQSEEFAEQQTRQWIMDRIRELSEREKKNLLNRVTRAELKELHRIQLGW